MKKSGRVWLEKHPVYLICIIHLHTHFVIDNTPIPVKMSANDGFIHSIPIVSLHQLAI